MSWLPLHFLHALMWHKSENILRKFWVCLRSMSSVFLLWCFIEIHSAAPIQLKWLCYFLLELFRDIPRGYISHVGVGENGALPQAEGQQCAWLLIEFQMDTLQLSRSDQFMRNNGCWTFTLQTILPTPEKQIKKRKKSGCTSEEVRYSTISNDNERPKEMAAPWPLCVATDHRFHNCSHRAVTWLSGTPNNFHRKIAS